jgi:hypothetical protein
VLKALTAVIILATPAGSAAGPGVAIASTLTLQSVCRPVQHYLNTKLTSKNPPPTLSGQMGGFAATM